MIDIISKTNFIKAIEYYYNKVSVILDVYYSYYSDYGINVVVIIGLAAARSVGLVPPPLYVQQTCTTSSGHWNFTTNKPFSLWAANLL